MFSYSYVYSSFIWLPNTMQKCKIITQNINNQNQPFPHLFLCPLSTVPPNVNGLSEYISYILTTIKQPLDLRLLLSWSQYCRRNSVPHTKSLPVIIARIRCRKCKTNTIYVFHTIILLCLPPSICLLHHIFITCHLETTSACHLPTNFHVLFRPTSCKWQITFFIVCTLFSTSQCTIAFAFSPLISYCY